MENTSTRINNNSKDPCFIFAAPLTTPHLPQQIQGISIESIVFANSGLKRVIIETTWKPNIDTVAQLAKIISQGFAKQYSVDSNTPAEAFHFTSTITFDDHDNIFVVVGVEEEEDEKTQTNQTQIYEDVFEVPEHHESNHLVGADWNSVLDATIHL
ncbi:hypothetical protein CYY_002123 [Polysphondylium violaceum]|uniref:Uncharacterized protein n=1 Tax=Polysphondylium violaceum TaxID=133409 RepID=A0A8J4Q1U7_9MYCE|nr:hypothetical protein CYY_002123 [Polysphondylium violaceum]